MRFRLLTAVCVILAAVVFADAAPLAAQSQSSPPSKPLLTAKDYGQWESLGATRLAPDGSWLALVVNRVNEENELRLRGGPRDTTIVIRYGQQPVFSADGRWVAYLVGVAPKERDRLIKEKKPVRTSLAARNLRTGDTISVPDVASFAFSGDAQFLSMTAYPAEGKKTSDVYVQNLAARTRLVFDNVSESLWATKRPLLALAITVDGGAGNAVEILDAANGSVRSLDASPAVYRGLSWRTNADDFAVLRSLVDKAFVDTAYSVLAWNGVSAATSTARTLDGIATGSVPAGTRIADYRRPVWSRDGATLFVGVRKREPVSEQPKKSDEKVSDVEIWHPNDVHVIPEQRSGEARDLRSTMLAAWRIGSASVMQLATDPAEQSTLLESDAGILETDRKPYPFGQKFGRRDEDVWHADVATGTRKRILTKVRYFLGADPTGRRVVWFDGKDYLMLSLADGVRINLTATLTGARGVDFVDRDDDHPTDVRPPIGNPTWTKDGSAVLVNSAYDVWSLPVDGTIGTRLTDGAKEGIEHRLISFAPFNAPLSERAIDRSKPMYFSLYGERTKRSGFARLMPGGAVQRLVFGDAQYGALQKADSVDSYAFTRQRFDESPNVHVAGADLSNATAMSATNAFQQNFAWGKAELMNFTSTIGKPLQAILYYPANYDASKKYPMIVYTYELLTQGFHRYIVPRENDYYNANVFTQQGYFVLMPDIVFRPREPGLSVLYAVEPAVRAVVARGLVDPARVGHAGHSQGGYEAAFLATHSMLFKTAVMGAGISDMFSFAGQMHWSSVPEFDHWETGQFRMEVAPWEDVGAMVKNSPLDKIHVMPAKSLLVEIGGDDPTVDMRQGVEMYNYARRAGKHVVMLLYPGEGHGLGKKENAIDYERRILQWFAHYLKDEPAPSWITNGQTWLERKRVLDANKP